MKVIVKEVLSEKESPKGLLNKKNDRKRCPSVLWGSKVLTRVASTIIEKYDKKGQSYT